MKTTDTTAAYKLARARSVLLLSQPFYGTLALRLELVVDNNIPTLAVDGKSIFYNEEFVLSLSDPLTRSALAHEVGHCVFDHITRRGARDAKLWNYAGDYVINDINKDAGFELGEGWLWDAAYKGMSANQIYDILSDKQQKCGDAPKGQPLCDIRQAPASETDVERSNWKVATVQAASVARAAGKLPAAFKRFIDAITSPKVDWREQLRRFVTERSKNDYSWGRPNRHFMSSGFFLPSLYSESMSALVNGIDTSGSIDQPMLNAFAAEITAAWESVRPQKMVNIYCDAVVNHVDEFCAGEPLHFALHGGGGTDLRKIFDCIERSGDCPSALIVLTDGYTPYPVCPPDYPVLWCMTTDAIAPFGETLRVEV